MHTSLSLSLRHTLHAVHTTLVLEDTIDAISRDREDDFLVAPSSALAHARDLSSPATAFAVAYIHLIEVTCEKSCFITARTAADLHDDVLRILWVCWDQEKLDLLFERRDTLLSLLHHLTRHRTELWIALSLQCIAPLLDIPEEVTIFLTLIKDALQITILFAELHEALLIGYDIWCGDKRSDLLEAYFQAFDPAKQVVFRCHLGLLSSYYS